MHQMGLSINVIIVTRARGMPELRHDVAQTKAMAQHHK